MTIAAIPVAAMPVAAMPEAQMARARQAAEAFEAMAIGQLLRPMFDTVDSAHGLFGGGAGEAAWTPMLVDQIARQMAAQGGLGLRAPILAEMLRMQEAAQGDADQVPVAGQGNAR